MPDYDDQSASEFSESVGSSSGGSAANGSTSSSLLERAKRRDPAAWRQLSDLYGPLIYRWCRSAGLQAEDAADVVQEVFWSLAEHLERFRKERPGDRFRGWLWTITRNKIRDHFRARKGRPQGAGGTDAQRQLMNWAEPEAPPPPDSSAGSQRPPLHLALEAIRGDFGETTWKAFWMTAVEQQSSQQAAQELGLTPNAVRLAKSRVLKRLREELGGDFAG